MTMQNRLDEIATDNGWSLSVDLGDRKYHKGPRYMYLNENEHGLHVIYYGPRFSGGTECQVLTTLQAVLCELRRELELVP